jgi:putative PIN family toxin of toxin-antitoxin system
MLKTLAVLDTNVLVSGLCRYDGSATHAIVSSIGVVWDLAITPSVFLEYEEVLLRPAIRRLTGLSRRQTLVVLDYLAQQGLRTTVAYTWRPNLCDETDNKFVECAIASGAEYLVTGNTRDFRAAELGPFAFTVIGPAEFARRIL